MFKFIRRLKPAYTLYNLLHSEQLDQNKAQLKAFKIKHSPYTSMDSSHFENYPSPIAPPLDLEDSALLLPKNSFFQTLDKASQDTLLGWSENGYAILDKYLSAEEVDEINLEIEQLIDKGEADWHTSRPRIMFAIRKSKKIRELIASKNIEQILSMLLAKEVSLFQSINFLEGSAQKAHSDSIHMTTYPLGYLIAIWIALEDIDETNGPLFYYPGSHKLPYLLNSDYPHGGNTLLIGNDANSQYEMAMAKMLEKEQIKPKKFFAKKGDVLIWHANLIHGGSPIFDTKRTRKSMVLHYFAKEVICYHEMTQRPALLPKLEK